MALGRTKCGGGTAGNRRCAARGLWAMTLDQAADAAGGIPAMHHRGQFRQVKIFRFLGSR